MAEKKASAGRYKGILALLLVFGPAFLLVFISSRGCEHKFKEIENILLTYPELNFVLIGDSGQEDPEIYHRVVRDYPDRILAVYIRNVKPHPTRIESIRKLGDEVQKAGSVLMLTDDTLAAARDAASKGWITESALGEVAEGAVMEHQRTPAGTGAVNRELSTEPPPPGVAPS